MATPAPVTTPPTDGVHATADKLRESLDGVGAALGELSAKAQHGMVEAKDRIRGAAGGLTDSSRAMVQRQPLVALAAGVGLGLVLGFVLGRVLFR